MSAEGDAGRFKQLLGRVLQIGSMASTALLTAGLVLSLVAPQADATRRLLGAGLVVLMATPAARVSVSVAEYANERDWTFVALTATVLLVLGGSLIVAMAH